MGCLELLKKWQRVVQIKTKKIMKYLLLCLSSVVVAFSSLLAENLSAESSYYENMSSVAFVYAVELINKMEGVEEKERIGYEVAAMAFTYFSLVELGHMNRSEKLDVYIQSSCSDIYLELSHATTPSSDLFTDPYRWFFQSESNVIPYGELSRMDKIQYEKLVSRFRLFIGISEMKRTENETGRAKKGQRTE